MRVFVAVCGGHHVCKAPWVTRFTDNASLDEIAGEVDEYFVEAATEQDRPKVFFHVRPEA